MLDHLIQTAHDRRPYYTTIPLFISDFRRWGHRVDTYPSTSLWIARFLDEENAAVIKRKRRARLLTLWTNEVLRRDEDPTPEDDIGSTFRDFVKALVRFDKPSYKYRSPYLLHCEHAIPPDTPKPLAFYTTLLSFHVYYNTKKPRLGLFEPHERVDCIDMRFRWHRDRRKEHLYEAMKHVQEQRAGRMGELRWRRNNVSSVRFYVKASEDRGGHAEEEEELPVYESEEGGEEGEFPPPYDEVTREPR